MRTLEEIHQEVIDIRKELEKLARNYEVILSQIAGAMEKLKEISQLIDENYTKKQSDKKEYGQ